MELITEKYKQTELGLIPSDWEVKTIGEIFTFYSTSNYSKAEMSLYGDVGCVHYGLIHAIENSHYSLSSGIKYYVTKEQAKYEAIQEGDVIMVDASEDLVGLNKSVEVFDLNNKEYIAGLHTFHLRDNNSTYVGTFKGLILNSNSVKRQMLRFAVGMKVFGVSKPQLQNILIPVPTKAEQTAIATALSDADALISSLEKLITKKRNIKQGAMQKLLQPKEGWEVKRLGEVCDFQNGTALEMYFNKKDGYKVISIGNYSENGIFNETNNFIAKYNYELVKKFILNKGELAFLMNDKTAVGTIIGRVLYIEENDKYVFNQRTMRLSPISKFVVSKFLFHLINSDHYHSLFAKLAKPGTQIYLNTSDVLDFKINIPNFEEQTRIATILSDMDAEITALEIKLEKYRKIKLGMMQNLLTGKIRLV